MAPEVARAYWKAAASQVATGRRLLLAAWDAGVLVGTVSLLLDLPENQLHRADVQKLLVLPTARRRGIAGRLLRAAEEATRAAGRTVLALDTRVGDGADALYRRAGWTEVGVIPDFTRTADGTPESTVIFYKAI